MVRDKDLTALPDNNSLRVDLTPFIPLIEGAIYVEHTFEIIQYQVVKCFVSQDIFDEKNHHILKENLFHFYSHFEYDHLS